MFERFIVATDLSEASYVLVNSLGGLRAYGAKECLLLLPLSMQESASIALSYSTVVLEDGLQGQKKILEDMGYTVETRVILGSAKKEINRIAVEENYSIIVVGAPKHSLIGEVLFEHLAYDVIHYTRKPVLIIRLKGQSVGKPFSSDNKISNLKAVNCDVNNHVLFPTDFSENADYAFTYLEKIVVSGVRKVTLLHVQDKTRISPHLEDRLQEFNKIDEARLQNMKRVLQEKADVEVEILIKFGFPAVEILNLVDELNVQLVVMGSQGRGFVKEFFLGSVSHNVARQSTSSVLLIPAKCEKN
ncbi:MAG: universal stress protein [Syntrophomonadaceae bacterium]|jgi:nucleotide-binding universal stress UspA family protein|nr:universal stress protein [Syntrophomonadaceae bacterium]